MRLNGKVPSQRRESRPVQWFPACESIFQPCTHMRFPRMSPHCHSRGPQQRSAVNRCISDSERMCDCRESCVIPSLRTTQERTGAQDNGIYAKDRPAVCADVKLLLYTDFWHCPKRKRCVTIPLFPRPTSVVAYRSIFP